MLKSASLQRVIKILSLDRCSGLLPYGCQLVFLHAHKIDTLTILATTVRHCNALRKTMAVGPTPLLQATPLTPLLTQSPIIITIIIIIISSSSSSSSSSNSSSSSSSGSSNNINISIRLL
jgi:hypothetical protein